MTKVILLILAGLTPLITNSCKSRQPNLESIPTVWDESPILRQDELAVFQLECREFEQLTPQLQRYAYHLHRAALMGRDLVFDQHAQRSLEIRKLLDGLMQKEDLDPSLKRKLTRYAVKFWASNGNYDYETSRKFVPEFDHNEFAEISSDAGHELLKKLKPYIFDVDFLPVLVNKNPKEGDIVSASTVNFYDRGITRGDVMRATSRYELNGRWALAGSQLVEEVYRAGAPDVTPGRMAFTMEKMATELEVALTYAPGGAREALKALIEYFRTGEPEAFDRHCRLWVKDNSSPVDYIIGFIEVYNDPLGRRGSYEGMIFIEDSAASTKMKALADNAAWFEERMPWEDRFRKKEFTPPSARAFKVLTGTGDGGPHCPIGINLPNKQELRETVGTKNFLLTNVMQTGREERSQKLYAEFLPTKDERKKAMSGYSSRLTTMVALHEVVGHGSGKTLSDLKGDPSDLLGEYGSTLEEARADLVALWFIGDPFLVELGVQDENVTREGAYIAMLAGNLIDLRDVLTGDQFEEDHARGGNLIANFVRDRGGAKLEVIEGRNYLRLIDSEKAHEAIGELLAQIQRIKATGDFDAAKKLVGKYGLKFDPILRDEVVIRMKPLDIPSRIAFAMPELEAERNRMGGIDRIKISYPRDFIGQMIRFGTKY